MFRVGVTANRIVILSEFVAAYKISQVALKERFSSNGVTLEVSELKTVVDNHWILSMDKMRLWTGRYGLENNTRECAWWQSSTEVWMSTERRNDAVNVLEAILNV